MLAVLTRIPAGTTASGCRPRRCTSDDTELLRSRLESLTTGRASGEKLDWDAVRVALDKWLAPYAAKRLERTITECDERLDTQREAAPPIDGAR